ncbi:hypothetical protein AMIS_74430 [Actinoplanes missouriensis 431]|uniref:Uncharacterized protein n=2 Tax=Actinoplanes missouriensis TaxID=1866 RepID=I0HI26_ACTM4|nr:hypothetical protein AMIS_74430 [Actinoplanes missouriensis 431]
MTAAGFALIAGGLATLISFWSVIFGGGSGSASRRRRATTEHPVPLAQEPPTIPAPPESLSTPAPICPPMPESLPAPAPIRPPMPEPVPSALPITHPAAPPLVEQAAPALVPPAPAPPRRRRIAASFSGRPPLTASAPAGLAMIGLADDEEPAHEEHPGYPDGPAHRDHLAHLDGPAHRDHLAHLDGLAHPDPDLPEDDEPDPEVTDPDYDDEPDYPDPGYDRSIAPPAEPVRDLWPLRDAGPHPRTTFPGYGHRPAPDRNRGDRVDNWVRPDYPALDDRPSSGEYWTPVPDDLYNDPEPSARGYGWPVPVERLPQVPSYEPATGFDLTPVQAAEPTTLVPSTWPPEPDDNRVPVSRTWRDREERRAWRDAEEKRPWRDRNERLEGRSRHERPRPRPRPAAPAAQASGYVSRHAAGPQP